MKPASPDYSPVIEFKFLNSLLQSSGLIGESGAPVPGAVQAFLESGRNEAMLFLIQNWLLSDSLSELRQMPGVVCRGEWRNEPIRTRSRVLGILKDALLKPELPAEQQRRFLDLNSFVQAVKKKTPDFQRSAGEYKSWHLESAETGLLFSGFDAWDQVEGQLLRFLICGVMFWLGLIDLAVTDINPSGRALRVVGFRFSSIASDLLENRVPQQKYRKPGSIVVRRDGMILIPRLTLRKVRYQIARFCEWAGIKNDDYIYQIDSQSLASAQTQNLRVEQFISILTKHASSVPPNILRSLHRWAEHGSQVMVETRDLLIVKSPELLKEIRNSSIARYLEQPLGRTAILVKPGAAQRLSRALIEMGYLGEFRVKQPADIDGV